ncbi:MAG: hypothetical protein U0414_36590 [Polyangiaceae bacterium]
MRRGLARRFASALLRHSRAFAGIGAPGGATFRRALFLVFATAAVVYAGALFLGGVVHQTGAWSPPVDAAYVHFDFARSAARGAPLEWSEGNGFSAGEGCITYPLVLALGFRTAFPGAELMKWACVVGVLALVGFLASLARVFDRVSRFAKVLLPPIVLSNGDLDFALASGAETAFLLGLLGAALAALLHLEAGVGDGKRRPWMGLRALSVGAACLALVLTRPEAIAWVLCLGVWAALVVRPIGRGAAIGSGVIVVLPALLALFVVGLVTFDRTGEWLPSGQIARLLPFDPTLGASAVGAAWRARLGGALAHVLHGAHAPGAVGFVPLVFALVPLADRRVRRYALPLWALLLSWLPIVALSPARPRAPDEMPAVALLLVLAALGAGVACGGFGRTLRGRVGWGARTSAVLLLALAYMGQHVARFRDAERAFASDARALSDVPGAAAAMLAKADPLPRRVLVAEPGVVTYVADRSGLDVTGRGGFRDLPFARAYREGLGAVLELIERIPDAERPDVFLLPTAELPDLPLLFGHWLNDVRAGEGDGARRVLHRADFRALDRANRPRTFVPGERLVAQIDVGDLVSEGDARYRVPRPAPAISFHVLTDGDQDDLFDAGRRVGAGASESFEVALPIGGGRLIARTAALAAVHVRLEVDGREIGVLDVPRSDAWSEPSIDLPIGLPKRGRVTLTPTDATWVDYHLWIVATP